MALRIGSILLCTYLLLLTGTALSESDIKNPQITQTAPHRDLENRIRDGTVTTELKDYADNTIGVGGTTGRVSVITVAWLTLAMAAATGLGAIPFFFVELEAQWAGVCNGLAAGVMLAASFDLIQEGQDHGSGSWVVIGILCGGIFILLCKKVPIAGILRRFTVSFFFLGGNFIQCTCSTCMKVNTKLQAKCQYLCLIANNAEPLKLRLVLFYESFWIAYLSL